MANPEHLKILKQGVEVWNNWREENPEIQPFLVNSDLGETDLRKANLSNADLGGASLVRADLKQANLNGAYLRLSTLSWSDLMEADLRQSDLRRANLFEANLSKADLRQADLRQAFLNRALLMGADLMHADLSKANLKGAFLRQADLSWSDLIEADLRQADLRGVDLSEASLIKADLRQVDLHGADLSGTDLRQSDLRQADLRQASLMESNLRQADLSGANLSETYLVMANLVETNLIGANVSNSRIYGIAAWNLKINQETKQLNLKITQENEPVITVDNLEVAQFVYLLLNNEKIRNVIDTIGEKGVLILGRFSKERKAVLDAIREKLRELGFVPMMFDFEKPTQRDFTETIKTLAGLSRFIIADITNPKSSPLELQATMPDYMIPFVPIIQEDEEPFAMFQDLQQKYGDWVLDVLRYDSAENLLKVLDKAVIKPALKKADELLIKKAEGIRDRHVKDYM